MILHRSLFASFCLLGSAAFAVTATDPFSAGKPAWTDSVVAAKPLSLELCYGETDTPFKNPDGSQTPQITPAFIEGATRLRIAVSSNDQGRISLLDKTDLTYRLATRQTDHTLDLALAASSGGNRRELNTRVTLMTTDWVVVGESYREEIHHGKSGTMTTKKYFFYAVVRLTPARD